MVLRSFGNSTSEGVTGGDQRGDVYCVLGGKEEEEVRLMEGNGTLARLVAS